MEHYSGIERTVMVRRMNQMDNLRKVHEERVRMQDEDDEEEDD